MKRSNGWWFVYAMLVPAMLGGFLAGWQNANAVPCTNNCPCKDVTRWWVELMPVNTASGAKKPGTTDDTLYAIAVINSLGGCKAGGYTATGTFDKWQFFYCAPVCTMLGATLIESTCTDTGASTASGRPRQVCK